VKQVASAMESLVDLVSRTVPSPSQTVALLSAWAVALAAAAGSVWLLKTPSLSWREVREPGGRYSVQFPGEPKVTEPEATKQQLTYERGSYAFVLVDLPVPSGAQVDVDSWQQESVPALAKGLKARIERSVHQEFLGNPGFEALLSGQGTDIKCVGFVHQDRQYVLLASVPKGDAALERFFDSMALTP
jgi:hypothetical protein